jgi:hypothetical protein
MPALPFVRLADQEDMKLALMLNVIDPTVGGVLIMGDRGTGKSVAVCPKCGVPEVRAYGVWLVVVCRESRARCRQPARSRAPGCVLAHTASMGVALLSASTPSLQPQQREAEARVACLNRDRGLQQRRSRATPLFPACREPCCHK